MLLHSACDITVVLGLIGLVAADRIMFWPSRESLVLLPRHPVPFAIAVNLTP